MVTNGCPVRSGRFLDGGASFNSICTDRDVCLLVVHPTAGYGPWPMVGKQVFQWMRCPCVFCECAGRRYVRGEALTAGGATRLGTMDKPGDFGNRTAFQELQVETG